MNALSECFSASIRSAPEAYIENAKDFHNFRASSSLFYGLDCLQRPICAFPSPRPSLKVFSSTSVGKMKLMRPRELPNRISPVLARRIYLERLGITTVTPSYPELIVHPLSTFHEFSDFLLREGLDEDVFVQVLIKCPKALRLSPEKNCGPVLNFLRFEVGVDEAQLSKILIRCPKLLAHDLNTKLRPTLQFLISLGLKDIAKHVVWSPHLLTHSVEDQILPRVTYLESVGIERDKVMQIVRRCPFLFNYSIENNLRPKVEYLINVMKKDVEELVEFPQFLAYSLESRIKPRYVCVKERSIDLSLSLLLTPKDEAFYETYNCRR